MLNDKLKGWKLIQDEDVRLQCGGHGMETDIKWIWRM